MRKLVVVAVAAAAALSACGPSPSTAASGAPTSGSVTTQQIVALAEQVFPKASEQPAYGVCGADLNFSACPYTDRLKVRLTELRETLFRGAQNGSTTREISAEITSPVAGIAHVKLFQGRKAMDLYVVRQGEALLVDEEVCAGRKETSIYATFVPCEATTGSAGSGVNAGALEGLVTRTVSLEMGIPHVMVKYPPLKFVFPSPVR